MPTKYNQNISKVINVMERTSVCLQTDRQAPARLIAISPILVGSGRGGGMIKEKICVSVSDICIRRVLNHIDTKRYYLNTTNFISFGHYKIETDKMFRAQLDVRSTFQVFVS